MRQRELTVDRNKIVMIQDLRKLREGARLSQKQVADILGIDQSQVSRYESDPSSLPFELGLRWHQALGQRVEVGFETPVKIPGMDAGAPYNELRRRLGILAEYCDIPRLASKSVVPGQNSSGIEQLSGLIQSLRRKPNLGLVGKFDAGKSRIANSLIGDDSLPTGYQPATRLVTIVRHLDDRPSWMREDVWIMSSGFDVNRADDEVHCKRYRVVAGNIRTLAEYGTYGGKHENTDAAFAMVYLPAPILKSCNIIDLPAFATTLSTQIRTVNEHLMHSPWPILLSTPLPSTGSSMGTICPISLSCFDTKALLSSRTKTFQIWGIFISLLPTPMRK